MAQKFQKGDLVHVAEDLGPGMSHFKSGCRAIVIGSYADKYGGENSNSYTLFLEGEGECSWYYGQQLTLIEPSRTDLLETWKDDKGKEAKVRSDLDWIFSNGKQVLENPHGASVGALARCFGLTNLWGSKGEGFVYYENAMTILEMARLYLESGDKKGWLNYCEELRAK